jgi:phosphatidylserine decarboxylase
MAKIPEPLFILFQQLAPQHALSRLVGRLAETRFAPVKNFVIEQFMRRFGIDLSEAEIQNPAAFENFNAFFTRALKPGARPITAEPDAIACPADGAISEIGDIVLGTLLQAKGQSYSLVSLLAGDSALASEFMGGKFATIYLSPRDYHRVHMPLDGTLTRTTYVPGDLYSVNQATANQVRGLFARNERLICRFDSPDGPFVMILVGAMIVAGIETVWAGEVVPVRARLTTAHFPDLRTITLKKGEEMGRFKLGSTVILLFPQKRNIWAEGLKNGSPTRMGEKIGSITER